MPTAEGSAFGAMPRARLWPTLHSTHARMGAEITRSGPCISRLFGVTRHAGYPDILREQVLARRENWRSAGRSLTVRADGLEQELVGIVGG